MKPFHAIGVPGVALACAAVLSSAAQAQPFPGPQDMAQEDMAVGAPYAVKRELQPNPTASSTSSADVELISLSRGVTYSDLDLSQPTDVATLEARVRLAAREACDELDRRYPKEIFEPVPYYQDCVRTAVAHAMAAVRELEAAAVRNPSR